MLNHTVMADTQFGEKVAMFVQSNKGLWDAATELCLDAIIHCLENSHDTSRPKRIFDLFQDCGQSTMLTAYREVLKALGGFVGVGGDNPWKFDSKKHQEADRPAEDTLGDLKELGLIGFRPAKKAKVKQIKPQARKIGLGEGISKESADALQRALDGIDPASQEQVVRSISAAVHGTDASPNFKSATLTRKYAELGQHLAALEAQGDVGLDKAIEATEICAKRCTKILREDFEALKDAANDPNGASEAA